MFCFERDLFVYVLGNGMIREIKVEDREEMGFREEMRDGQQEGIFFIEMEMCGDRYIIGVYRDVDKMIAN